MTPSRLNARTLRFGRDRKSSTAFEIESGHTLEFRVEASRDVNKLLLDPEGQELGRWDRADHIELNSFKAEVTGEHILEFDNSYSRLTRKSVTLLYRVLPPGEN